jgi:hypothetical protein
MDSMDNFRERFEALEQQMQVMGAHTRTVERRQRWWRGIVCGLLMVCLVSLPLPAVTAENTHAASYTFTPIDVPDAVITQ